jgi:hypothetical protein
VSTRLISQSEAAMLLDCQAKHDFAYVGRLAGSALRPRLTPPLLREGRAWGRAVALFHSSAEDSAQALHDQIVEVLRESLEEDAEVQRELGVYLPEIHEEAEQRLTEMLAHYVSIAERLPIERLEDELVVPIPSRTGRQHSNRYRLQVRLDGVHTDDEGREWIVEFKLRKELSPLEQIALSRQIRWYAWAWREITGRAPIGVIVDERLNKVPKEVALNKDGRPSRVQSCIPEAYEAAGGGDAEVLERLRAKRWHQRERMFLTEAEIDEAGHQLVSVARQIQDLDSGRLYPVRNPSKVRCPGCQFREICPHPEDAELADALFERVPAKQYREEVVA